MHEAVPGEFVGMGDVVVLKDGKIAVVSVGGSHVQVFQKSSNLERRMK